MTLPTTRDQAITLLQRLGYDTSELSPEETEAIRRLYFLDDNRPLFESGKFPEEHLVQHGKKERDYLPDTAEQLPVAAVEKDVRA